MPAEYRNPSRVLLFGKDANLLQTRAMVLRSGGMVVDVVVDIGAFKIQVGDSAVAYAAIVCCYTASDFECDEISSIAKEKCISLITLQCSPSPQVLIEQVADLIRSGKAR